MEGCTSIESVSNSVFSARSSSLLYTPQFTSPTPRMAPVRTSGELCDNSDTRLFSPSYGSHRCTYA